MNDTDSELQSLAEDYLEEDPSILTYEQLKPIQDKYNLTNEQMHSILKGMTNARKNLDPHEINR